LSELLRRRENSSSCSSSNSVELSLVRFILVTLAKKWTALSRFRRKVTRGEVGPQGWTLSPRGEAIPIYSST
jgi:hypothetical protein